MRPVFMALLLFAAPLVVQAEYTLVPLPEPVPEPASLAVPPAADGKLELPATQGLLLPFFEVNKLDPTAETSLFSVRNVSNIYPIWIGVSYITTAGGFDAESVHNLGPRQTLSVNINDVPGLTADSDGVARGSVVIQEVPPPKEFAGEGDKGEGGSVPDVPALVGDYFQVIQNQDFATGDRLLLLGAGSVNDFCERFEARFLNGGAFSGGTDLVFLASIPQGADPLNDPPTAIVTVTDEAGDNVSSTLFYTEQFVTKLSASELAAIPFGTLEIAFSGTTGTVSMTYSAQGRFSVGMDAACKDRYAADLVVE